MEGFLTRIIWHCATEQAEVLQGLYTLWYAAGTSLGILPALPGQQKDVLPHFAIDLPVTGTAAIKDGRLGYTNHTLTWQVRPAPQGQSGYLQISILQRIPAVKQSRLHELTMYGTEHACGSE